MGGENRLAFVVEVDGIVQHAVSYTHLDVYKRQVQAPVGAVRRAGRQVAVAGREGRSRREAVAEVRVHAYRICS